MSLDIDELPNTPAAKQFLAKCKKAAKAIDQDPDDLLLWSCLVNNDDQYEDDGNLHVEKAGVHVCFGIGQDILGAEYNRQARLVMEALGMKRKISDRVLVDEDEDEDDEDNDDYCSYCGRDCRH